jgi:hypothetical protein
MNLGSAGYLGAAQFGYVAVPAITTSAISITRRRDPGKWHQAGILVAVAEKAVADPGTGCAIA